MNNLLKQLFLKGVMALAAPGCKLEEAINPFNSSHLGDRAKYYGASEMAAECQLKPVLERIHGKSPFSLQQTIVTAIGHLLEMVVYLIFCAVGKKPKREVAVYHPDLPWCRATIDFLWPTASGAKFMELKSSKDCPEEVRTSHRNQIILQMGIWLLNNPGKQVSGVVMVIDRTLGVIREYPVEYNHILFLGLVERAKGSWAAVHGQGPMPAPCPTGLCGYCEHRTDYCPCGIPVEGAPLPPDVAQAALDLARFSLAAKEADAQAKRARLVITGYAGKHRVKSLVEGHQVSVYQKNGRKSLDQEKLKGLLVDQGLPEETVAAVFAAATKPGKPTTTVEVVPI